MILSRTGGVRLDLRSVPVRAPFLFSPPFLYLLLYIYILIFFLFSLVRTTSEDRLLPWMEGTTPRSWIQGEHFVSKHAATGALWRVHNAANS